MRTLSPVRPFSLWLPTPDARLSDLLFLPYCCCRRRRRCVSYTFRTICQKAFSHSQRLHLINHINYNYPENLCAFLAESWRLTARRKCVLCFGFFVYFFLLLLFFSVFQFSAWNSFMFWIARPPPQFASESKYKNEKLCIPLLFCFQWLRH